MSVYNFAETIVAGSSAQGGDGIVQQSLKFDRDQAQYLKRTPAGAGNRRLLTLSGWFKRTATGEIHCIMGAGPSGASYFLVVIGSNDKLVFEIASSGSASFTFTTTQVFRDTSAWYHLVFAFDTAQATAANRVKLYVNGSQVTAFDQAVYPAQNYDFEWWTTGEEQQIGQATAAYGNANNGFDGYIADVCYLDGIAASPSSFGETKDGNWIPKDTSGLTFGTNGFRLDFQDDVVSEGFNTVTWTGTGADNSISGIGFSPALVWIKDRTDATAHYLFDVNRGALKDLYSNLTAAEYSAAQTLKSFDGDGFTLGNNTGVNGSADDVVAWCWEGGGTPTADNSASAGATPTAGSVKIDGSNLGSALAGSIAATRLSANTTKGFSVVTFTSNGSDNQTVAHGLGAVPKWIIVKKRSATGAWVVGLTHTGFNWANDYFQFDTSAKRTDGSGTVFGADPTSTLFTFGSSFGSNGTTLVAYCWSEVSGYSKFGSYTGNGSSTGPTVTTNFAPAFVMVKRTDGSSTGSWFIVDNTRDPRSSPTKDLQPNSTATETDNSAFYTFTSTGFQLKTTGTAVNASGGTYIYMAFADTREAAFFKDTTTNGNNLTPVNLDYRDSLIDSPTNNWSTLNSLKKNARPQAFSEGNLVFSSTSTGTNPAATSTFAVTSGKWYWESYIRAVGNTVNSVGIANNSNDLENDSYAGYNKTWAYGYQSNGQTRNNANASYGDSWTTGDIISVALDLDAGAVYFYKNGTIQNSGTAAFTSLSGEFTAYSLVYNSGAQVYNFGQDSTFNGAQPAGGNTDGNGRGTFKYAVPNGYLSLCNDNLTEPSIANPTDNFNTVLYTGDGSTQNITGVGFEPDFVWIKARNDTSGHQLYDTVRGATKRLRSQSTGVESTESTGVTSFDSDGFTTGSNGGSNESGKNYAAWNWKAGGTPTATNSAGAGNAPTSGSVMIDGVASTTALNGDIPATKISANTKSGFSIVSYTGTGATNPTVNHGLTKKPEFIILKDRDSNSNNNSWNIWHKDAGDGDDYGYFTTAAFTGSAQVIGTDNNVFTLKPNLATSNESGDNYIAYLFHSVEGMTKVGSYTGNNSADGPFVYTGFRPAWVMTKRSNGTSWWGISDNVRSTYNEVANTLAADQAYSESSLTSDLKLDFLSNGFKIRDTDGYYNASGGNYIYLAFAEISFKETTAK